ncbi:MAG: cytochrome c oxidase subunit 3 [Gammaproteobacteria bacterium]|mgnify:CR=1 FL=1|jgi:cytochrome c oxidase subunit 3|nr:cytochrome c oxidase subunit 3 [Gammaproteobacteria bacterium]MBT3726000.1 cytochrome c oxidase subunit 3 [Gammaproteobacteria bacterium]MBT4075131.1 cytochrome c oxidase subunit 3 [Gammaproteobacteria bacterium]MBT4195273.1 cytochrome c oxidase subunit 3 [Gammaproteobacteria bacterium]MBT4448616.1 cytochrome c oxidase subunit 3 [Gammaproteobacteria bacterium]
MTTNDTYFIPEPSRWPIISASGVFVLLFGFILMINDVSAGSMILIAGLLMIAYIFFGWFGTVIDENLQGSYGSKVSTSFRQGMFWFITSEVFFFLTFFACLYYFRGIAIPSLSGEGHQPMSNLLWDGFQDVWPLVNLPGEANLASGTTYTPAKETMGAGGIPLWNTIILLSSGATLTWAHWGLKKESKNQLVLGLMMTVTLGLIFFGFQAYEYYHAYTAMDLKLSSGIYGSTFYMLTGFHGLHVTIGTIMLIVITIRSMKNHFTEENHFAFEAVAWYWHFVDVVWIGLYFFVYWL